jgi:hypothetical protein
MASIMIGLAIAGGLLALAATFAWLQWRERRTRPAALSEADASYFRGKDFRRLVGSLVMALIAVGMFAGLTLNPRDRLQRGGWATAWIGVLSLVPVLLILALGDWIALRRYAIRHRRALEQERHAVADQLRRLERQPPDGEPLGPDR